jgi:hypothetical protein
LLAPVAAAPDPVNRKFGQRNLGFPHTTGFYKLNFPRRYTNQRFCRLRDWLVVNGDRTTISLTQITNDIYSCGFTRSIRPQ